MFETDVFEEELAHEGVLRKSGRYPWGSGDNPNQRNKSFLDYESALRKQGMSEVEIAAGWGITTTELRAAKAIAKTQQRSENQSLAQRLKDAGHSNIAIGQQMGINESSVRALLDPSLQAKNDILGNTAAILKKAVDEHGAIDVGSGVEQHLDISRNQLLTAVAMLKEDGYTLHYVNADQLGTGKQTKNMAITRDDVEWKNLIKDPSLIKSVAHYSDDGGRSFDEILPPLSISSKRVAVRYAEDGGGDMDGVIQIRRNVKDLDMGAARYAQVRIAVDGSHYLKGMAMYADDLPDGTDIRFNTNKSDTGNKLKAMKPMKDDPTNPFGSVYRQIGERGADGKKKVTSALNLVNEEGNWDKWSKSLSSQVLSKQSPALAKQQLELRLKSKQQEYDEIMALTNPSVRKRLLESFSDDLDSSAVHLKAAALPRQRTQVILPINSLKDTEVFAPNFRDGEKVVLIRYPHGGRFEIPELTVNNRNREAGSVITKSAKDAIGINSKVASRLSGADFDGDTVLVIPNNSRAIQTMAPLKRLEGFDPQTAYPAYEGMKKMSPRTKQLKMGDVSNLITDMTIQGATKDELARAVRHSMVVIDAEKHNLDWKQSAKDHKISQLKTKYQEAANGGASTLVSRASSQKVVNVRKPRAAADGGPIDKATGKKVFVETGEGYTIPAHTVVTARGERHVPEQFVPKTFKSTQMAEVSDARKLISNASQPIERVYADYANQVKSMANSARKDLVATKSQPQSPTARKVYAPQVASLNAKLNLALRNAPLERQAQLIAGAQVKAKQDATPGMDSAEVKKLKGLELNKARIRTGAKKIQVTFEPDEWEAIQAGAISASKLERILANADLDSVKALATPREKPVVTATKLQRAKQMLSNGYTQAEIADAIGVPASTLNSALG